MALRERQHSPRFDRIAGTVFFVAALGSLGWAVVRFTEASMDRALTVDFPWLLETGREILGSGSLPAHDIFTWTSTGKPWMIYQWFFEVLLAGGETAIGLDGVFRVFLVLAAGIYLYLPLAGAVPRKVPFVLTALFGCYALTVGTLNLSVRPLIFTTLFLVVQYIAFRAYRRRRVSVAAMAAILAPVYLLWGNMHLGVILGIISMLLMLAGDSLERLGIWRFNPADPDIEGEPLPARRYLLPLAVAFGSSLVNPYGLGIYTHMIDVSMQAGHTGSIDELASLNFHLPQARGFLLFTGLFVVAMIRADRALSCQEFIHLIGFTAVALFAGRLIVWAVAFQGLIMPKMLYHHWVAGRAAMPTLTRISESLERGRGWFFGLAIAAGLTAIALLPQQSQLRFGPCEALLPGVEAYVAQRQASDRLFNDPTTGSCLLLRDHKIRTFIDTRFDFFGEEFMAPARAVLNAAPGWKEFLDRQKVNTVAVGKPWPLGRVLAEVESWRLLYDDGALVVFRRDGFGGG